MALERKNKDMYRQVVNMYWDYIKTYPHKKRASECHYYIAEILFGTGDYLEAAKQYIAVARKYRNTKYCETAAMNAIVAAQNLLKQEETARKDKDGK
jgi:TolA-binding protein